MKKFVLITLFLWIAQISCAQIHFPDSVQTNKEKAVYLNQVALMHNDKDSMIVYYSKAIPFGNLCNDCDSIMLSSHFKRAVESYYNAKLDEAKKYTIILDSVNSVKKLDYFSFKTSDLYSKIYSFQHDFKKALTYAKQSVKLAKRTKDSMLIAESIFSLGNIFLSSDLGDEAIKYFKQSEKIYDAIGAYKNVNYSNYVGLIRSLQTKDEIDYYLAKIYDLVKNFRNHYFLTDYYTSKADVYLKHKFDINEAKKSSLFGLRKADSLNLDYFKRVNLANLAEIELSNKNYTKALKYLKRIESEVFKKQDYEIGSKYIILKRFASAYKGIKNYKKAYEYEFKADEINDSIINLRKNEKFAEFDAKFKTAQKDKEIAKQQVLVLKQKSAKNKIIGIGIILLLIAYALFQWIYNQQKRKKIASENELQKEQEINDLRTKFLGNIAHEIRTPLTLISGNLELAKENINQKEKALQNIDVALTNSKKVVEDANEILELLKFEKNKTTIKLTTINLDSTLKRVFYSFKSLATLKNIRLDYQSDFSETLQTKIDVEKVEKILNNLVSNAIKYSPSNSKIIFNATLIDKQLKIKVTDFGQGIHFDETEKVFQRFYQASNSQSVGGIGIGLSLAKEFAELLGGRLTVTSKLKKGSTFTFNLPIQITEESLIDDSKDIQLIHREDLEKENDNEVVIPKNLSTNDKKPSILIVEDNPEMSNYLVEILQQNYQCTQAFDGLEALKILKNNTFDLITSDIMMPNLDGFEFRKKLNKDVTFQNIPFILISAKTLSEDKIKGFQLGIDDYVVKPFQKNELLARIKNLLSNKFDREKWKITNKELLSAEESSDKKLLKKIETIILKNISDETFKITELASSVGYSQRQLTRILKQYTGMSPVKFILEIRLQKAFQNLQNHTFFSLSEVRFDVGITSSSYFNKKFKERFGINPSELLKS